MRGGLSFRQAQQTADVILVLTADGKMKVSKLKNAPESIDRLWQQKLKVMIIDRSGDKHRWAFSDKKLGTETFEFKTIGAPTTGKEM